MKIESNRSVLRDVIDFLHKNIIIVIVCFVLLSGTMATLFLYLENDGRDDTDRKAKFKTTDTLYFSIPKPENMNVLTSDEEDVNQMWHMMYASLFYYNRDLSVSPDLVEEYKTNSKHGSVKIKLKDNAKFSNGNKITATDVADSVDWIKNIGDSGPFYSYASKIASVDVKGDTSAVIHFENPSDASLSNLVFPIISSEAFSKDTSYDQVTSGPYLVKSSDSEKMEFSANPGYYGKKVKNKISFLFATRGEDINGLITIGAITGKLVTGENAQSDAENLKLNFKPIKSSKMEYIGFNFRNSLLKKKVLRKSILKSINFDQLVDDYFVGLGVTNDSIYYPGFLGVKAKKPIEFSPSKSVVSLEKAGYKRSEDKGVLIDPNGKEVKLKLLINESSQIRSSIANDIKNFLKKIDIEVEVEKIPNDEYFSRIEKGEFDIYLGGIDFDPRYDTRKLFDKSGSIGYPNEDVINLVNKMEFCLTPEKRKANYQKLCDKLSDDVPFYCIGYYEYGFASGGRWNKQATPTFFNPYYGCENWQWQKPNSIKDKSNLKKKSN